METDDLMREVRELKRQHDLQREKISELHTALTSLIEAQRITTKNVDTLSKDVKEMIKNSLTYELLEKEIVMINHRLETLEDNKAWLYKMVVGAVIMAGIGLILDIKSAKGR